MPRAKVQQKTKSASIGIESNIPLPPASKKYPFGQMKVGDSFFVPDTTPALVSGSRSYWTRKTGAKYAARTVDGGVRFWRVK
jgi:hypothetical protein